jgi:predicted anti-sigma-YlaC factor YlaD
MNCKEVRILFTELYDNELNQEMSSILKRHLSSCSECKVEYKTFKKSLKVLKQLELLEPPRSYLDEMNIHEKK